MEGGLATSTSSSPTTAQVGKWTYDVFVSFCGEDTRKNFVDHLYAALDQAGLCTFKDDQKIQTGKSITPELVKTIQESMVAVVVFSKNYTNSAWCLEELTKIMECRDLMRQRVLPVFYDVDPSDVRGQKDSFHEAFQQHEMKLKDDMEKVKSWKEALVTAGHLSGWNVPSTIAGPNADCIKQIVWNILSYTQSHNIESCPADNLIGIESLVQYVKSLLGKGPGDVCIVGIWGMGGIGKTTIARAVYHQISYEFEGSCFLENVRENSSDNRGLKSLQEKILTETLMEDDFELADCDDGMFQIQRTLSRTKVLLVLDDVDNIKQLKFLAGAREWFGPGSRIMITTRDEHLLSYAQGKFTPELLTENEAMKLFSRYAFKASIPPKAYEELSAAVVSHTGCHPLALKVLGSHLCGKNMDFWQSALNAITKIPHKEINGILKLSFDGLNILEQKILLHIASFYQGRKRSYVTRILDSCGFEAVSGITVLIQKSLLTLSNGNLRMHDLVREMCLSIVREYYPNTLVWCSEDIKELMKTTTRLETVEAIVETEHDESSGRLMPRCSAKVLKNMKKLKLLEVNNNFTSSEPTCFPEELQWLSWSKYPFLSLKITRDMSNLVGLQMSHSNIQQLQMEKKVILTNLKSLDLNRSYMLTSIPDFSVVPNLERVDLTCCMQLSEIHQSIFLHEKITHLYMSGCISLKYLPSPLRMKSLQTLVLDNCERLEKLPEVSMEMSKLLLIDIRWCDRIRALPSSFGFLTGLTVLKMGVIDVNLVIEKFKKGYSKRILPSNQGSIRFGSLRILDLDQNHLTETDFPSDLHNAWPLMEELNITRNNFTRLPATISLLSHLKRLDLSECVSIKELPELPSFIQALKADGCTSLQKIEDLSNKYKWLFKISFCGSTKLLEDQESESYLANCLMKSVVQRCAAVNHRLTVTVPGSKIPDWFSNKRFGNKIALNIPQNQITKIKGLAMCCLLRPSKMKTLEFIRIKFKASCVEKLIDRPAVGAKAANHVWIGYLSVDFLGNICHGFGSEDLIVSFETDYNRMMECGVCVVYEDDIKSETGNGSWVIDYDELERGCHDYETTEDLHRRRGSFPSFWFGDERTGQQDTVYVDS